MLVLMRRHGDGLMRYGCTIDKAATSVVSRQDAANFYQSRIIILTIGLLLKTATSVVSRQEAIDSLFDEFTGELITIPPRIINREHEEYISLMERLLYDNSSSRPPEDFHANPNTIIESLLTFPIPVEDSDSLREEIDIFPGLDDSIPSGIESDDYDSEGNDNSTSLPEFESFHVDYPDSGDSTINVVEDIPVDVPNILGPSHPSYRFRLHSFS
ncbi:hypothetical protein Tco_1474107 [Tanacetum coccineum]